MHTMREAVPKPKPKPKPSPNPNPNPNPNPVQVRSLVRSLREAERRAVRETVAQP